MPAFNHLVSMNRQLGWEEAGRQGVARLEGGWCLSVWHGCSLPTLPVACLVLYCRLLLIYRPLTPLAGPRDSPAVGRGLAGSLGLCSGSFFRRCCCCCCRCCASAGLRHGHCKQCVGAGQHRMGFHAAAACYKASRQSTPCQPQSQPLPAAGCCSCGTCARPANTASARLPQGASGPRIATCVC